VSRAPSPYRVSNATPARGSTHYVARPTRGAASTRSEGSRAGGRRRR
jgi:hypothetical protein